MSQERTKSLSETHGSVDTTLYKGNWRKLFAFFGPAYLVSVGYMDPGNWATDIAGGSAYGYTLLWVLVMSNIMAILFQSLSARLGVVRGMDLAQVSREAFPPVVNISLYILAEIAIAACDLAEVLGFAIGIKLLFKLPLLYGVLLAMGDTLLLLFIMRWGVRKIEAFIIALVVIMGVAFLIQLSMAHPQMTEVAKGLIPVIPDSAALYIAIGIIGATVMPHNLYLHSALVQSRLFSRDENGIRRAIRFNNIDGMVALNLALFVNAAILILAGAVFHTRGLVNIAGIEDAYKLLHPLLGTYWAPLLFAIALIASGQSSTITGTLAGQVVMEGYINIRISPWLRRLITRSLAVTPAAIVIGLAGENQVNNLLILSQVILSMQLSFAIIPLIHFVSDKTRMQQFVLGNGYKIMAWFFAVVIVVLNAKLVMDQLSLLMATDHWILKIVIIVVVIITLLLLVYVSIFPFIRSLKGMRAQLHETPTMLDLDGLHIDTTFKRIAIAVDYSEKDEQAIRMALNIGGTTGEYLLIHITESAGSIVWGSAVRDLETEQDAARLKTYEIKLQEQGYHITSQLGFGRRAKTIADLTTTFNADLLVMGAHGHHSIKDFILGETITNVRHAIKIPVLVAQ